MASFRRLAKDHAALQSVLPPNYLFPDTEDGSSFPDDLTQLSIFVTGAEGTPYAQGLWRLHLKMPNDYPKNPPKATFKTRIYHPNVDEKTGAVCLETLKRDWDPKLTLKDILVTISCLLIQPNPDSALNAAAGALIQEDYDAFATQAQLMARVHAPIPQHLSAAVREAKRRGEEPEQDTDNQTDQHNPEEDDTKENDPRKSSEPPISPCTNSQSHNRGKRPLSELPAPEDPDTNASADADSEHKRKSPRTTSARTSDLGATSQIAMSVDELDQVVIRDDTGQQNEARSKQPHPSSSLASDSALCKGLASAARRRPRIGIRRL